VQRIGGEALGDGLGEHRTHAEGRPRRRGQEHAAQHRPVHPVRGQEEYGGHGPGQRQQHDPLVTGQGLLAVPVAAGQRQQTGQPHGGEHRSAPGRRARAAPYEDGRHRQREDDGEGAQRLHQAQRPVGQRHDVQQRAEAVQRHGGPPAAPAQRGVRAVRRRRRDLFLDDRAARVREGGHEAEQDRKR
jgi:hypothetical protein